MLIHSVIEFIKGYWGFDHNGCWTYFEPYTIVQEFITLDDSELNQMSDDVPAMLEEGL